MDLEDAAVEVGGGGLRELLLLWLLEVLPQTQLLRLSYQLRLLQGLEVVRIELRVLGRVQLRITVLQHLIRNVSRWVVYPSVKLTLCALSARLIAF